MSDNARHEQKTPLPLSMLALKFFGSVLMALSLAKKFGGINLWPAVTQIDQSGWLLTGLGFF